MWGGWATSAARRKDWKVDRALAAKEARVEGPD